MLGLAIGLACGFAQFYLLTKLTNAITRGLPNALYYVLGKIVLLILTLAAGVLFARDQLVLLGVGIAAPLLIGSTIVYFRTAMNLKTAKTKSMHAEKTTDEIR